VTAPSHTVLAEADGTAYASLRKRPVDRAERYARSLATGTRSRISTDPYRLKTRRQPRSWDVDFGHGL